ncbi:hypothetical protein PR048_010611, partial [Dryococelus australis]
MVIAVEIFSHLKNLNKALQGRKQTVSGALAAAETVKCAFKDLRIEARFDDIFERCNSYVEELDSESVKTPRIRKPPNKYSSEANCHLETGARKYFRNQFYEALDTAVVQTEKVFDIYPEIDSDLLKLQVPLFRKLPTFSSLEQAATELRSLTPYKTENLPEKYLDTNATQLIHFVHVHKEELDRLNLQSLCTEFINRSDVRKKHF